MTPLSINLQGDNAWPELVEPMKRGEVHHVPMTHVARLPMGTVRGKSAVIVRGTLPDGRTVVLETTAALFINAAKAIEAREQMEAANAAHN